MTDLTLLRKKLVIYVKSQFSNISSIRNIADDVVNGAFETLYASKAFSEDKLNLAYMKRICTTVLLKKYYGNKEIPVDRETLSKTLEESVFTEDDALHGIDRQFIFTLISTLNQKEQRVLYLRYYYDLNRIIIFNYNIIINVFIS